MAHPSPDGDGVLIADLGRDAVDRFRLDTAGRLVPQASYAVPGGPRHFLRSGSRWYVVCELSGTLAVFSWGWRPLSVHSGLTTPSEIVAFEDRFLYIANRGPDTVSVFSLAGGVPRHVASVATGGQWPRHLEPLPRRPRDRMIEAGNLALRHRETRLDHGLATTTGGSGGPGRGRGRPPDAPRRTGPP